MNYQHTMNYYTKDPNGKWKRTKTEDMGIITQEQFDMGTNKETMSFFKRIGAKETIQKSHNGARLTSISPTGTEKRVHIYTKIGATK